ncbi:MAG: zinc-ribbon and DUF3426 domain-containing protein [Gammaproteobacteria bacterium]|nr:zinc-ribbon and DUF3426 domain-containing protein [Gammaproteobacteria bacterium]
MQSQCPTCKAIFRVHKEQLKQADGLVRCGQCDSIFNGYDHLLKNRDKVAHSPEMLKRMLLGRSNITPAATVGWSLTITLASMALLLQLAYLQRDWLAKQAHIGPYIETVCQQLSWCTLQPERDLNQLQLVSRNVYSHPNIKNALMINAVITNTASFPQPYPTLLVSMSNVRGQIVAQRYFKSSEYLQLNADQSLMEPGKAIPVSVEVLDPGQDALAFELDFL